MFLLFREFGPARKRRCRGGGLLKVGREAPEVCGRARRAAPGSQGPGVPRRCRRHRGPPRTPSVERRPGVPLPAVHASALRGASCASARGWLTLSPAGDAVHGSRGLRWGPHIVPVAASARSGGRVEPRAPPSPCAHLVSFSMSCITIARSSASSARVAASTCGVTPA